MKITRTANAGVLLELDGIKMLLDGVCREVTPYPATPDAIKTELSNNYPDLVAVTHCHEDHSDPDFEAAFQASTGKQVIDASYAGKCVQCGNIRISVISSRHIGKLDCEHVSFIIEGSQCVWFMGDASPNQWKNKQDFQKPDVLICPFAYATTDAAWKITCGLAPKTVILLHLPEQEKDSYGLWNAVEQTIPRDCQMQLLIPNIGQTISLN